MCHCHGKIDKNEQAFKIVFVYLHTIWLLEFFTIYMQQACNNARNASYCKTINNNLTERFLSLVSLEYLKFPPFKFNFFKYSSYGFFRPNLVINNF